MRQIIYLTIGIAAFGLGYWTNEMMGFAAGVKEDAERLKHNGGSAMLTNLETFDSFVYRFISDSLFQMDRVKFPLTSTRFNLDKIDSTAIEQKDWKITRLFGLEQYKAQIYDNFEGKLRDTNERLFCWEGVENGINVKYKFSRIDGLWYLVEFNDLSD